MNIPNLILILIYLDWLTLLTKILTSILPQLRDIYNIIFTNKI